jgi:tetratricopeptide (TPR) repeat protein
MRVPLALLGATALLAQTAPGLDPEFFMHDPKTIMVVCADKARAARPDDSRALAEFGRIYLAAGDRDRALDAFQRAARFGKRDAATHALIAQAWLAQGAKAEAMAAAGRALELAPKNKAILSALGLQFTDAGFPVEGNGYMERAYAQDPKDWEMAVGFGRAFLRGKNPDLAAVWFRHALTGRAGDDAVYKIVGLAYADHGARP